MQNKTSARRHYLKLNCTPSLSARAIINQVFVYWENVKKDNLQKYDLKRGGPRLNYKFILLCYEKGPTSSYYKKLLNAYNSLSKSSGCFTKFEEQIYHCPYWTGQRYVPLDGVYDLLGRFVKLLNYRNQI